MTNKHRFALVTILVAALIAAFLLLDDRHEWVEPEALIPPEVSQVPADAAPHDTGTAAAIESQMPMRVPVEEPSLTVLDPLVVPEGGRLFEFEVRVVDHSGISVEDAEVFAAPHGLPPNRLGSTGADGRVTAKWYGRTPKMEIVYYVNRNGRSSSLFREVLFAGESHRALVPLESPVLRLRRGNGGNFIIQGNVLSSLWAVNDNREAPLVVRRESGEVGFRDPLGWGGGAPTNKATNVITFSGGLDLNLSGVEIVFSSENEPAEDTPPRASISGMVRDRSGDPVGGVPITLGPDEWRVRKRIESDEEGRFLIDDLSPQDCRLRAGGGPYGLAVQDLVVSEGQHLEWNPVLDRGLETRGLLITKEEAPLANWRVELSLPSPHDPWVAVVKTAADGRFVVPNCPSGSLRLQLFAPEQFHLPTAVIDGVSADDPETQHVLETPDSPASAARVGVVDAQHKHLQSAKVRLWQPSSDRGTWFTSMQEGDRRQVRGVPPGLYEVEAGYARWGWTETGPFIITHGDVATDLGTIQLPTSRATPGTLVLRLDPADSLANSSLTWSIHRRGDEVIAEVLAAKDALDPTSLPNDIELIPEEAGLGIPVPVGEFILRLHHPDHGMLDFPFEVLPAERVGLRITREKDGLQVEQVEVPLDPEESEDR